MPLRILDIIKEEGITVIKRGDHVLLSVYRGKPEFKLSPFVRKHTGPTLEEVNAAIEALTFLKLDLEKMMFEKA